MARLNLERDTIVEEKRSTVFCFMIDDVIEQ